MTYLPSYSKVLLRGLLGPTTLPRGLWFFFMGFITAFTLILGPSYGKKLVQSLNSTSRHSEISCGKFWTIVTHKAMEIFNVPVMADSLMATIATFHTSKIFVSDPTKFSFVGSIPESMYDCVSAESKVMAEYKKLPPTGPRALTPEMQKSLELADKPAKWGK